MAERRYAIKEVFNTIQGEGARAGTRAVFVRFSGCNLWTGRPEDRAKGKGACARWCDTDFVGGDKLTAKQLIAKMNELWPFQTDRKFCGKEERWCVLTGGEPMLQVDAKLLELLNSAHWHVAVETNGSIDLTENDLDTRINWLCVSPKLGSELRTYAADELKVVLPGAVGNEKGWTDAALEKLERVGNWNHMFVQPQDPINSSFVEVSHLSLARNKNFDWQPKYEKNLKRCIDFVMTHPTWRLGLQGHKFAGLR